MVSSSLQHNGLPWLHPKLGCARVPLCSMSFVPEARKTRQKSSWFEQVSHCIAEPTACWISLAVATSTPDLEREVTHSCSQIRDIKRGQPARNQSKERSKANECSEDHLLFHKIVASIFFPSSLYNPNNMPHILLPV